MGMHIGQRATLVCLGLTLVSWSLNAAGAAWLEAQDFDELHLVVSSPADPVVQHAAERFQRLWAITTGHTPSLSAAPELHAINVWLGNENRFLPPRELAGLGNEGFYIKTIDAKQRLRVEEIGLRHRSRVPLRYRHLVIAGGSPRGLLYGVYEFFQAGLGWRWPTATYAEAPKVTAVPAMDYRYDPPFMLRDANLAELKPVSLAFNLRLNGPANTALPPQFGGTYIQAGTVLVNPSGVAAQASGKAPAPPPARDAILCLSDPARAGETAAAAR
ncbi:MAG: hypothetical protein HYV26_16000, partial [Candidatus Hydrogenedentes bacterium]|nr:hypothetical protein [Candidatus Hydrogenedentota bacterium]